MKDLRLCFVKNGWAYFTSIPVVEQWGDDWDVVPYEYSAGEPSLSKKGKHKNHNIVKVAFESNYIDPSYDENDIARSVEMINKGDIPWLRTPPWVDVPLKDILVGTSLEDFIRFIDDSGGEVYLPSSMI